MKSFKGGDTVYTVNNLGVVNPAPLEVIKAHKDNCLVKFDKVRVHINNKNLTKDPRRATMDKTPKTTTEKETTTGTVTTFKKGDKVKLIKKSESHDLQGIPLGATIVIEEDDTSLPYVSYKGELKDKDGDEFILELDDAWGDSDIVELVTEETTTTEETSVPKTFTREELETERMIKEGELTEGIWKTMNGIATKNELSSVQILGALEVVKAEVIRVNQS